ncbi:hypothetical protein KDL30_16790, partial [bacterium]|nr:hypothetical protein [bacterium]
APVITMQNGDYGTFSLQDMEIVNGRPALFFGGYFSGDCVEMGGGGAYQTALDDEALSWSVPVVVSRESVSFHGCLLELDGLPAIVMIADPYLTAGGSFGDGLALSMSIAEDPFGNRWHAPVVDPHALDNFYYSTTFFPRDLCMMVDGKPSTVVKLDATSALGAVFN